MRGKKCRAKDTKGAKFSAVRWTPDRSSPTALSRPRLARENHLPNSPPKPPCMSFCKPDWMTSPPPTLPLGVS